MFHSLHEEWIHYYNIIIITIIINIFLAAGKLECCEKFIAKQRIVAEFSFFILHFYSHENLTRD